MERPDDKPPVDLPDGVEVGKPQPEPQDDFAPPQGPPPPSPPSPPSPPEVPGG
jgi:hypothetical protein